MFSPVALGAPVSPLILIIPLILVVAIIKTANDYIRKKHIEYLLLSIVFLLLLILYICQYLTFFIGIFS